MTLGENAANSAVDALESVEALDGAALKLAGAVSNAVPVGVPRDALSGTWLGHALHPLLTDVVIGSFISATLLDLLGGDDTGRASERLIEVGLVTAAPTVASGLNDWAMTVYGDRRTRPVGLVHAVRSNAARRRRGNPCSRRARATAGSRSGSPRRADERPPGSPDHARLPWPASARASARKPSRMSSSARS
jgi:hypothetical protein